MFYSFFICFLYNMFRSPPTHPDNWYGEVSTQKPRRAGLTHQAKCRKAADATAGTSRLRQGTSTSFRRDGRVIATIRCTTRAWPVKDLNPSVRKNQGTFAASLYAASLEHRSPVSNASKIIINNSSWTKIIKHYEKSHKRIMSKTHKQIVPGKVS